QPGHGPGQVTCCPPGDACRAEEAVVRRQLRHAGAVSSSRALDQTGDIRFGGHRAVTAQPDLRTEASYQPTYASRPQLPSRTGQPDSEPERAITSRSEHIVP